jgi:hypothetical protein
MAGKNADLTGPGKRVSRGGADAEEEISSQTCQIFEDLAGIKE